MIVSERMQPLSSNRVIFRRLDPVTCAPTIRGARYPICQPAHRLSFELMGAWLRGRIKVTNWVVACAILATVGVSAGLSASVVLQPSSSRAIPVVAPISAMMPNALTTHVGSKSVPAQAIASDAAAPQVAMLQTQVQSMAADLERLQQEGDTLRNESHASANDLTSARTTLAEAQESRAGESQQLTQRLDSLRQSVDSRLGQLGTSVSSADQTVAEVRSLLGLPSDSSQRAVGGP